MYICNFVVILVKSENHQHYLIKYFEKCEKILLTSLLIFIFKILHVLLSISLDILYMDLRTSRAFYFTTFGQCINVLNYNVGYTCMLLLILINLVPLSFFRIVASTTKGTFELGGLISPPHFFQKNRLNKRRVSSIPPLFK